VVDVGGSRELELEAVCCMRIGCVGSVSLESRRKEVRGLRHQSSEVCLIIVLDALLFKYIGTVYRTLQILVESALQVLHTVYIHVHR